MPILAAYLLPHSPLLLSASQKGSDDFYNVLKAYETVAKKIAELKPDTIVFFTPHSEAYADYFQVADGEVGLGALAAQGAPNLSFRLRYDKELIKEIDFLAQSKHFPMGTSGGTERRMDHGTMIPLHFIEKEYRDFSAVRIGMSGLSILRHYEMGEYVKRAIQNIGRNAVIIASGDLSHTLSTASPYGLHEEGERYDAFVKATAKSASFSDLFTYPRDIIKNAHQCAHRVLTALAGTLNCTDVTSSVLAYEEGQGRGLMIAEFVNAGEDPSRALRTLFLKGQEIRIKNKIRDEDEVVALAREAIRANLVEHRKLTAPSGTDDRFKNERFGCFVTVKVNQELRGCMGSISPRRKTLGEEIVHNAVFAATRDERFLPILPSELPYLDVAVDIIQKPIPILSVLDLDPRRYGIIVEGEDKKRAVLLPNLPGIATAEDQLERAKRKAGISPTEDYHLFRFEVETHN